MAVDTYEGVEPQEVLASLDDRIAGLEQRVEGVDARLGLVELGHDLSDERLMWVSLDERLCRLEEQQSSLLRDVRAALGRL